MTGRTACEGAADTITSAPRTAARCPAPRRVLGPEALRQKHLVHVPLIHALDDFGLPCPERHLLSFAREQVCERKCPRHRHRNIARLFPGTETVPDTSKLA